MNGDTELVQLSSPELGSQLALTKPLGIWYGKWYYENIWYGWSLQLKILSSIKISTVNENVVKFKPRS